MIDSVPLIQNANDAQQINASIIAMKKASRELDEKILKLNNLNSELDKKIALLDSGLTQEIADRQSADNTEVTNRNTAITNAINALDVSSVGGSGKYISAISETDGKISATASDITSTVSSGNSQPVTSGGVANAIAYKKGQMSNEFYSGGTYNGGFVLLAHAQTRNVSGGKAVAISGNVFLSIQNTSDYSRHLDAFEFLLSVRNTSSSTIFPADFRVSSKDGNTQSISSLFFATYKRDSNGVVHIYLYTKIVNYYNRYVCEVENFFTGDVYDNVNLPDAKVDMTTAYYSSIPSNQTAINVTPSIIDSVVSGDLRAVTSNAVYDAIGNYNTDSSSWFSDLQKTEILTSFNSVQNYNSFQGQTQAGLEGRWLGYRNNNYGCAIYMTRTRIIALYITGGEISKIKTIIDLS